MAGADRATWLAWRRGGVGGSDLPALTGHSRFASPTYLYYEKRGELGDDPSEETSRMRLGRRAEAMAAAEFRDHTGLFLVGEQTWCEHAQHRHHRCTIDGFVVESEASWLEADPGELADLVLAGEETKCTSEFARRWSVAGVPLEYRVQALWSMHVTGLERWAVLVFYGLAETEVCWIDRDQRAIDDLVELADRFWQQVTDGTPPPADGHERTTEALLTVYPKHSPHTEVDLDEHVDIYTEWLAAKALKKKAEGLENTYGNQLRQVLADAEVGLIENRPAVTYRSFPRAGYFVEPTTIRPLKATAKKGSR